VSKSKKHNTTTSSTERLSGMVFSGQGILVMGRQLVLDTGRKASLIRSGCPSRMIAQLVSKLEPAWIWSRRFTFLRLVKTSGVNILGGFIPRILEGVTRLFITQMGSNRPLEIDQWISGFRRYE